MKGIGHSLIEGTMLALAWMDEEYTRNLSQDSPFLCQDVNPNPPEYKAGTRPEEHLLSSVRDCLFSIFSATLCIWKPFSLFVTWRRAVSWWQDTHLTCQCCTIYPHSPFRISVFLFHSLISSLMFYFCLWLFALSSVCITQFESNVLHFLPSFVIRQIYLSHVINQSIFPPE
jgi:hypothetical protein